MNLSPREKDKLMIAVAAMVATDRKNRGVKLNHPEAIALITNFVMEGARDGRSVADLMSAGGTIISKEDCMEGVAEMIHEVQVCLLYTSPSPRDSFRSRMPSSA